MSRIEQGRDILRPFIIFEGAIENETKDLRRQPHGPNSSMKRN